MKNNYTFIKKSIKKNILFLLPLFFLTTSYSQCVSENLQSSNFFTSSSCVGATEAVGSYLTGGYTKVNVLSNKKYTFSSSVGSDYITITDQSGTIVLASGTSPLSWTSNTTSGVIRYYLHADSSCAIETGVVRTKYVACEVFFVTCNQPSGLSIAFVTSDSSKISWIASSSNPDSYDVFLTTSIAVPDAATIPTGNAFGFSFLSTNLLSNTTYYYWLRSNCGNIQSSWVSGGSITTQPSLICNGAGYGLKPETTFTPSCTGVSEIIATNSLAGEYSNVNIISNKQYTFKSSVTTDYITITNESGNVVLASGITPLVWLSTTNSGSVRYFIHSSSSCTNQQVSRVRSMTCSNVVEPCNPPTNLRVNGEPQQTTATIAWEGSFTSDYHLILSTTNVNPNIVPNLPRIFVPDRFINLTGLSSNTTYYFWVRTICISLDDDYSYSVWVPGGSFTTLPQLNCNNETYPVFPSTTFTPACTGVAEIVSNFCAAGEYSKINILPNKQYTFRSSVPTDYITITNAEGRILYSNGVTPLVWLSGTNTGVCRYYFHTNSSCGDSSTSRTKFITCAAASTLIPLFNQVGPICSGTTLADLPTTSTNGITGVWSPSLNNTVTSMYTFTPNVGQSATATTMIITVNQNIVPTFTQIAPSCPGQVLDPLPTTSLNGVSGTWSPALNNLATTLYTFTPDIGQCASSTSLTISVNPLVAPMSLSATSVTVAAATLNWTTSSPTSSFDYYLSTSNSAPDNTTVPTGTTSLSNVTLTSLNSGTTYYYWVRSVCGSTTSTWVGNNFTTEICSPPSGLSVSGITTNSATLNWTAANPAPSNGYQYYYNTNSTPPTVATVPSGTTAAASVSLSALSAATTYYFWIRSNCGATTGNWVGTSFSTLAGSCNAPSALNVTGITAGGATLNWTAANPSPSNGYQYYYSMSNTTPTASTTPSGNATSTTTTLTALNANTVYYYWVRSNCGVSQGSWVTGTSFTTSAIVSAGCTTASFGLWPIDTFSPSCTGTNQLIADNAYAGEYSYVNIAANKQYTFSSSVATDYITIANSAGTLVLAHGPSPFVWPSGANSGEARYYLHTNASCGEQDTNRSRFIKCSIVLGSETFDSGSLKLFPNPTTHLLNISSEETIDTVTIFNMLGQLTKTQAMHAKTGVIDMSALPSGTYFARIVAGDTSKTLKVIKE